MSAEKKDFDAIMREITAGLSGDGQADIRYLNEQTEKYKDHEMGQEIARACGRLIYGLLPKDKQEEVARMIENDASATEATLEEVRFNIYKKDFDKALQIMEALVGKVEELNAFQDDQVSQYHVFDEWFEEILYRYRYKPEKDLRQAQIPYTEIYMLYGSLLVEIGRYIDAQEALKKGLRWNPVSFTIMSEYIETFKMMGDLDRFFTLSLDAFKIAFHSKDVARCYRNLGYYFVEKEQYSQAIGSYLMSLQFDRESGKAQSELYYISTRTGRPVKEPSLEQMKTYAETYGFPLGADKDVLGLSFSYGRHFVEENEPKAARYFLNIAYDLTDDEDIKEILDKLSEK